MKIKAREYHVFRQDLVPEDHVVDYEFMDMNEDVEVDMLRFAIGSGMYICSGKGLLAEIEILGYVPEEKLPAFMAGTVGHGDGATGTVPPAHVVHRAGRTVPIAHKSCGLQSEPVGDPSLRSG